MENSSSNENISYFLAQKFEKSFEVILKRMIPNLSSVESCVVGHRNKMTVIQRVRCDKWFHEVHSTFLDLCDSCIEILYKQKK